MSLSAVDKVRLRIGDTSSVIFTDAQINDFLEEQSNNILLASADALYAMAADNALLAKMKKIGSFTQDTRGQTAQLRETADAWRREVRRAGAFGVAEVNLTPFHAPIIIHNAEQRNG